MHFTYGIYFTKIKLGTLAQTVTFPMSICEPSYHVGRLPIILGRAPLLICVAAPISYVSQGRRSLYWTVTAQQWFSCLLQLETSVYSTPVLHDFGMPNRFLLILVINQINAQILVL